MPTSLCDERQRLAKASDNPRRSVANIFIRERQDTETAKCELRVTLSVDLALEPGGVGAMAGHFYDEITGKICIDSSNDTAPIPKGLLQDRPADPRLPDQTQKPALKPALTAGVDESVE